MGQLHAMGLLFSERCQIIKMSLCISQIQISFSFLLKDPQFYILPNMEKEPTSHEAAR